MSLTSPLPDPSPGRGHNQPPDPGAGFRRYAWAQAKAAAVERLSPAQARRRIARAAELGMEYPTYASVLRMAGRDPAALLFTPGGLGLRLPRRLALPAGLRARLAGVQGCHLLALAPADEAPEAFLEELRDVTALPFAAAGVMPARLTPWQAQAAALRLALDPLRLTGAAVVLVGAAEAALCAPARLGAYLDHAQYFRPAA